MFILPLLLFDFVVVDHLCVIACVLLFVFFMEAFGVIHHHIILSNHGTRIFTLFIGIRAVMVVQSASYP